MLFYRTTLYGQDAILSPHGGINKLFIHSTRAVTEANSVKAIKATRGTDNNRTAISTATSCARRR